MEPSRVGSVRSFLAIVGGAVALSTVLAASSTAPQRDHAVLAPNVLPPGHSGSLPFTSNIADR
jgi:hypothetical protein